MPSVRPTRDRMRKRKTRATPSPRPRGRRPALASPPRCAAKIGRTLETLVGTETYRVWCGMLASLVPSGRTHRLAPLVGGMLQHAAAIAAGRSRSRAPGDSVVASLLDALDTPDPEAAIVDLQDVVGQLFRDARVSADRVNARGDGYSIADAAIAEFVQWGLMPWE